MFNWLRPNNDWQVYDGIRNVRMPDGTIAKSPLMRRCINGEWHYRYMTTDELNDFISERTW